MITWFCFLCLCFHSRIENWFHGLPPGRVPGATEEAGWTRLAAVCCLQLGSPSHKMAGWNPQLKPTSLLPLILAGVGWQRWCRQSYFQQRSGWGVRGLWPGCQRWRNQGVWILLEGRTRHHHWRYRTQRKPFLSHHKAEQWETAEKRPDTHKQTHRLTGRFSHTRIENDSLGDNSILLFTQNTLRWHQVHGQACSDKRNSCDHL